MANGRVLAERGIDTRIPYTVDENGAFTADAPGFEGKRVINDKGEKGDANEAVIKALVGAGMLLARGRLTLTASDEGRAIFGMLDLDRDRQLGAREVLETFARVSASDRDGDVSRREFLGTREQFERLDGDHDGLIAPDEAEAARPVKAPGG